MSARVEEFLAETANSRLKLANLIKPLALAPCNTNLIRPTEETLLFKE